MSSIACGDEIEGLRRVIEEAARGKIGVGGELEKAERLAAVVWLTGIGARGDVVAVGEEIALELRLEVGAGGLLLRQTLRGRCRRRRSAA